MTRAAVLRGAGFLIVWLVIAEPGWAGLAVGVVAAALATRLSFVLLPPGVATRPLGLDAIGLLRLVLHVAWQSVPAGIDVARRALSRDCGLSPGLVAVPTRLPPGLARASFRAVSSLLPGTVAVGTEDQASILLHALDVRQDVTAENAATEGLFVRAIRADPAHG
jgi:multicomponent Na+:H+ antiporter subunit E